MADRVRAPISLRREDRALARAASTRGRDLLPVAAPSPATPSEPPTETDDPEALFSRQRGPG